MYVQDCICLKFRESYMYLPKKNIVLFYWDALLVISLVVLEIVVDLFFAVSSPRNRVIFI